MNKLEIKKTNTRFKIWKIMKDAGMGNPKTIESREIIEFVMRHGAMYKYQKVWMLSEIIARLNCGEYNYG